MLTSDEIRAVQFPCVRLRAGYDQREVDEFLDVLDAQLALRRGLLDGAAASDQSVTRPRSLAVTLTGPDVLAHDFSTVRLRQSYECSAVDDFMRRAAQSMDEADTDLRRWGVEVRPDPRSGAGGS